MCASNIHNKSLFIIAGTYYMLEETKMFIIQTIFEKELFVILMHHLIIKWQSSLTLNACWLEDRGFIDWGSKGLGCKHYGPQSKIYHWSYHLRNNFLYSLFMGSIEEIIASSEIWWN